MSVYQLIRNNRNEVRMETWAGTEQVVSYRAAGMEVIAESEEHSELAAMVDPDFGSFHVYSDEPNNAYTGWLGGIQMIIKKVK